VLFRKHKVNKKHFFKRPVWRNTLGNITVHPLKYYEPENLSDVLTIVQEAINRELPVRAVGSGHSFSNAPYANGLLIDTSHLDDNLGVYQHTDEVGNFVEFESGIRLSKLNDDLDKMQLAIPTMGGINHMALAGAIQTGTHGSNLGLGALSQIVKSLVLVTNNLNGTGAKAYRIEKTAGFTNPDSYPSDAPELIQDDEVFRCVLVSFGGMGIIYSLVIEVEPLFYLEEQKTVDTWENVKAQLRNEVFRQHRSVFVLLNPYSVDGERLAMLATQDRVPPPTKFTLLWQDIKHNLLHRLDKAIRNPVSQILGNLPLTYWVFVWLINTFPKMVPKLINQTLKGQRDKTYINKSYKVMYQGYDYLKERGYDTEFAIPLDQDTYVNLLDDLFDLVKDLQTNYGFQLSSPLELRFLKASDLHLTPEYGSDVCYIDTAVVKHAYGNEVLLARVQQLFMRYGARPHWGKTNEQVDKEYIKQVYPKYEDWIAQFHRFNHNRIFSNRFTKQMVE
jgi:hypothetical protein